MASMFPVNPDLGQITTVGKTTYQWNGVSWAKFADVTSNNITANTSISAPTVTSNNITANTSISAPTVTSNNITANTSIKTPTVAANNITILNNITTPIKNVDIINANLVIANVINSATLNVDQLNVPSKKDLSNVTPIINVVGSITSNPTTPELYLDKGITKFSKNDNPELADRFLNSEPIVSDFFPSSFVNVPIIAGKDYDKKSGLTAFTANNIPGYGRILRTFNSGGQYYVIMATTPYFTNYAQSLYKSVIPNDLSSGLIFDRNISKLPDDPTRTVVQFFCSVLSDYVYFSYGLSGPVQTRSFRYALTDPSLTTYEEISFSATPKSTSNAYRFLATNTTLLAFCPMIPFRNTISLGKLNTGPPVTTTWSAISNTADADWYSYNNGSTWATQSNLSIGTSADSYFKTVNSAYGFPEVAASTTHFIRVNGGTNYATSGDGKNWGLSYNTTYPLYSITYLASKDYFNIRPSNGGGVYKMSSTGSSVTPADEYAYPNAPTSSPWGTYGVVENSSMKYLGWASNSSSVYLGTPVNPTSPTSTTAPTWTLRSNTSPFTDVVDSKYIYSAGSINDTFILVTASTTVTNNTILNTSISSDSGQTWSAPIPIKDNTGNYYQITSTNTYNFYNIAVSGTKILLMANYNALSERMGGIISSDSGASWQDTVIQTKTGSTTWATQTSLNDIIVTKEGKFLVAGTWFDVNSTTTGISLFLSDDGINWADVSANIPKLTTTNIYNLYLTVSENGTIFGVPTIAPSGTYLSTDRPTKYQSSFNLLMSTDGGNTWSYNRTISEYLMGFEYIGTGFIPYYFKSVMLLFSNKSSGTRAVYSLDFGITWYYTNLQFGLSQGGVASNSKYILIPKTSTNTFNYSKDGIIWYAGTFPGTVSNRISVVNDYFVVPANTGRTQYISKDLTSWETVTISGSNIPYSSVGQRLKSDNVNNVYVGNSIPFYISDPSVMLSISTANPKDNGSGSISNLTSYAVKYKNQ